MSNTAPEQLDLTQPIDRVVKQIVDLATAEREAKGWWQAILRLVPKEHHAPADVIRYLEERLNAWGGLLVAAGFEQGDGVSAAQRITDEVRAYARLRGGLALRLGAPRNAADAVLLERLNDLASHAHGEESLRERNAGLKAALEEARPKAEMWDSLKQALGDMPDNDVIPRLRVAIATQRQVDEWPAHTSWGDVLRHVAKQRDELAKAQALIDRWDMQYQDLRDKVADFHTQISRALGVEPLSLTADEMLRRIAAGAAATSLRDRLVPLLFPDAISASDDALMSRVEKALADAGLLRELDEALQAHAPNHAAQAAVAGASTVGFLLEKLRAGEIRENGAQHARLVEALHVGRPASEVKPDELVEWAEQTYAHRALGDRLTAALRRHTPFESVERLCTLLENGTIAEMIRRSDAWKRLVDTYNEGSAHGEPSYLQLRAHDAGARLELAVRQGVQLLRWMREQSKTEG